MARRLRLRQDSRYIRTTVLTRDGKTFFDVWKAIDFPPDDADSFVTVKEHMIGRLDKIAFDFYGNEALWWVISRANLISNQFINMEINQNLRLPARGRVFAALFS